MSLTPPYAYTAVVRRVVDADTIVLDVDLGFGIWLRDQPFRLAGCNTRERSEPGGQEAYDYLTLLLPEGRPVLVRSIKHDKYGGRYNALVELPSIGDLTEYLIRWGFAARWNGRGSKPVPVWPRPEPAVGVPDCREGFDLARGERRPDA